MIAPSSSRVPSLTPQAKIERAQKKIAEGQLELAKAVNELAQSQQEWVDQQHSPLGKRRHLDLCAEYRKTKGASGLPHSKEGHKLFVRRDVLNRYLEEHGIIVLKTDDDEGEDDIIENIVKASTARKPRRRRSRR